MLIRLASTDDVPAILAISNWAAVHTPANFAVTPEPLESWLDTHERTRVMFPWMVAEADGRMLGFAKASPHRGRCAYGWTAEVSVYVHHEHHRTGVGTRLYERLIPLLEAQRYATLIAGITVPNPASQRLHERFGFKPVGVFQRVGWKFNAWHDVGFWQLNLLPACMHPQAILPVKQAGEQMAGRVPSRDPDPIHCPDG